MIFFDGVFQFIVQKAAGFFSCTFVNTKKKLELNIIFYLQ